jgi:hypothetical protein
MAIAPELFVIAAFSSVFEGRSKQIAGLARRMASLSGPVWIAGPAHPMHAHENEPAAMPADAQAKRPRKEL